MRFRVQGLDHVAIGVADQTASRDFYRDVLGLERRHADAWGDHGVAHSLYFVDPDGNRLELTTYDV